MQRILNDLQRARLSRGRMNWLLAHTLPPSPVSKFDRRHTGRLRKRDNLLREEGLGRGWSKSQIIQPQESLVLYESFSILCVGLQYIRNMSYSSKLAVDEIFNYFRNSCKGDRNRFLLFIYLFALHVFKCFYWYIQMAQN